MESLFETISRKLSEVWRGSRETPRRGRSYRCDCGRAVFFRNSECLGCRSALGFVPALSEVRTLHPGETPDVWTAANDPNEGARYRRCANLSTAAGCNWLVEADDPIRHCRSCRLNRKVCDQSHPDNQQAWRAIENAKRRLVSQLLAFQLPVRSKVSEDADQGLMFDFLRSPAEGPRVLTGHAHGLITLNVEEANDAIREKIRHALHEPYRTLLGHFRHEVGHYYWDRLVAGTKWIGPFRELFGDERVNYAASLKAHYEHGPPADWKERCISSYASTHPWEDWAESWAHYLHLVDSLDTALGFGLTGDNVEPRAEPFDLDDLYAPDHPDAPRVLGLVNSWLDITAVLNEMAQSMGQPDFYPFVMSRPVLRKLHFIHLVVKDAQGEGSGLGLRVEG
jgi:hypothetical protein